MKQIPTGITVRNFKDMSILPAACIGYRSVVVAGVDAKPKLTGYEVIQVCHLDSYPAAHPPPCKISGLCVWSHITRTTGPPIVADQSAPVEQQLSLFTTGEVAR